MQPAEATEHYGGALKALIGEKGRPLHPVFSRVYEGWVDPTARPRPTQPPLVGDISAEERSWMSVLAYYGAEGCAALLTPLGLALLAECALNYIAVSDEEVVHGYHGLEVDPWHEVRHVPAEAREQFARALWHIHEGLKAAGLRPPDGGDVVTPKEV